MVNKGRYEQKARDRDKRRESWAERRKGKGHGRRKADIEDELCIIKTGLNETLCKCTCLG